MDKRGATEGKQEVSQTIAINRRGATESKSADFHSVTSQWRKRAATEWTMGKLLSLILAMVLLVLIIYGISTGAINPLKERIVGMYDNVLGMFGWGEGGVGDSREFEVTAWIYDGDKKVTVNTDGWCRVGIDEGDYSGTYRIEFENGRWVFKKWDKDKEVYRDIEYITASKEKRFIRGVYEFLNSKRWNLEFYSTIKDEYYKMWLGDYGLTTHFWFDDGGDKYAFGRESKTTGLHDVCLWAIYKDGKKKDYTCSELKSKAEHKDRNQLYHDLKNSLEHCNKNEFEFREKKYELELVLELSDSPSGDVQGRFLQFEPDNPDLKNIYGIDYNGVFYIKDKEWDTLDHELQIMNGWKQAIKKDGNEYWYIYVPENAEGNDWNTMIERGKIRYDLLDACGRSMI